jgi:hypothetical protein
MRDAPLQDAREILAAHLRIGNFAFMKPRDRYPGFRPMRWRCPTDLLQKS